MDLFTMIKTYGEGQGKDAMWKAVRHISDFAESMRNEHAEEYRLLKKHVYSDMQGGHFNEEFGQEQIAKMYFKDDNGKKHYAPYWTEEQMHKAYEVAKSAIPAVYTEWDFRVTLNMIRSDNQNLLEQWFPEATEDEMTSYFIDMAINFLCDEDAPHPHSKIWDYFN